MNKLFYCKKYSNLILFFSFSFLVLSCSLIPILKIYELKMGMVLFDLDKPTQISYFFLFLSLFFSILYLPQNIFYLKGYKEIAKKHRIQGLSFSTKSYYFISFTERMKLFAGTLVGAECFYKLFIAGS